MKITPAIQKKNQKKPGEGAVTQARAMLREGETLRQMAVIHWGIYWKGVALLLLAVFLLFTIRPLGLFLLLVSAVILSFEYLTKYYLLLALTDKRVMVRHGIINLDTVQMHYNRIESAEVFRPLVGRILGYGTVLITGTGSRITAVPFVANADAVRAELDKIIFEREESRDGGKGA